MDITIIILTILLVLTGICILYLRYLSIRSSRALKLLMELEKNLYDYNSKCIKECRYDEMLNFEEVIPFSYDRILFSIKPLKYKNFISQEHIE